jgi:hypothetical protein
MGRRPHHITDVETNHYPMGVGRRARCYPSLHLKAPRLVEILLLLLSYRPCQSWLTKRHRDSSGSSLDRVLNRAGQTRLKRQPLTTPCLPSFCICYYPLLRPDRPWDLVVVTLRRRLSLFLCRDKLGECTLGLGLFTWASATDKFTEIARRPYLE